MIWLDNMFLLCKDYIQYQNLKDNQQPGTF